MCANHILCELTANTCGCMFMLYAGRLLYSVLCAAIDIVSLRNANMVRYANCKLSDKTANAMLLLFSVC